MTDLTANLLESAFRWLHVLAGVLWLGTLFFYAWIGGRELATLTTVTTRALQWVRWSAAINWVSGLLLLGLVNYHTRLVPLGMPAALALGLSFGGVGIYEWLARRDLLTARAQFWGAWVASSIVVLLLEGIGLPLRASALHLGALLGSIMAFNVWFRIWPAYRGAGRGPEDREADTPQASVGLPRARLRARHNAYLSVPVLFLMLSPHASTALYAFGSRPAVLISALVLAGLGIAHGLERLAPTDPEG